MKIRIRNYMIYNRPFINLIIVYYLIIFYAIKACLIVYIIFGFPKHKIYIAIKEKLSIITRSSKNKYQIYFSVIFYFITLM